MKTILLFLTLFTSSLFQFADAQSLSNFYNVSNKEHVINITEATNKTIKLESINEETIDIKFLMKVPTATSEGTKITFSLGTNQTVDFIVPFSRAGSGELQVAGKTFYGNSFLHYGDYDETGLFTTFFVDLRIAKDNVRAFLVGEMGGSYPSEKFSIDNHDITIKIETTGKAELTIGVNTAHLHDLNCFSDNGLKIRQTPDLKGKQVGSIPFGEKVYVLDNLDRDDFYNGWSANTQGNLKVGDVSSKMIKVLHGDKIGYAYGGFLMPFERLDKKNKKAIGIQGWSTEGLQAEEVYYEKELALQKMIIMFDGKYGNMDVSQQKFLLTRLFPNAFTMAKLSEWCEVNKEVNFELNEGNFTGFYNLFFEKNQLIELSYKKIRKGFIQKIATPSSAYVVASQLNMRSSTDPKSDIVTKIPMGGKVAVLKGKASDFMVIGGVRGKMTPVKYNNQEGYVFDAYLSPTPLLPKTSVKPYDLTKTFNTIIEKRGFDQWEHNRDENYEWAARSMIIPSRDKFQAIKTLREFHPLVNDLKFRWNESTNDYDITTDQESISIQKTHTGWMIYKEIEDGSIVISVETLDDNLQKITIYFEGLGC